MIEWRDVQAGSCHDRLDGKRGWTALLLRRYPFTYMGIDDHEVLFGRGTQPTNDDLLGAWRLDALLLERADAEPDHQVARSLSVAHVRHDLLEHRLPQIRVISPWRTSGAGSRSKS